jgi:GDPmannose 4,6-dehydratase
LTRAIVVGSGGQDGRLLFDLLAGEGASVVGIERTRLRTYRANVKESCLDLRNHARIAELLGSFEPDEVYYLAAHHAPADHPQVAIAEAWKQTFDVHVYGLLGFLEGIRLQLPETRLFYAASSLIFGRPGVHIQDERTPLDPRSVYAISKAAGLQTCRFYRERSVFASVGILYNHESSLRPEAFVTQKIVRGALRIRAGQQSEVVLGDLSAQVDWGAASDFVRAMTAILRVAEAPDDFVVATGQPHSVADFARIAFDEVGLSWRDYVRASDGVLLERRGPLVGDSTKLRTVTGWRPMITFEQMVRTMVGEQSRGENDTAINPSRSN